MKGPVAVVDLGTQSCLLLVGRLGADGGVEVLEEQCEIPKMGAGLDRNGVIGEAALGRVEDVLGRYLAGALGLGCAGLLVGGTAALRRAGNQAEVCRRIEALGIEVEVIGEAREARLGWRAAAGGGDPGTCVVDVGGGSTEVVADGGRFVGSAPLGASVLAERFGDRDWDGLLGEARRVMGAVDANPGPGASWVALGGTASNLGSLDLGLEAFDHRLVEGHVCRVDQAFEWGRRLAAMDLEQRLDFPIEAQRAEGLPAGLACLVAMLEKFEVTSFRISGRGLRFALLEELLGLGSK